MPQKLLTWKRTERPEREGGSEGGKGKEKGKEEGGMIWREETERERENDVLFSFGSCVWFQRKRLSCGLSCLRISVLSGQCRVSAETAASLTTGS